MKKETEKRSNLNVTPVTARNILLVLFIMQPILDIISFGLSFSSLNILSTILRTCLLGAIVVYLFMYSDHKKTLYTISSILLVFTILHMYGNFEFGYISIFEDLSALSRMYFIPYYILLFRDLFYKMSSDYSREDISKEISKFMVLNLFIITTSILLSYIINMPSFTYYNATIGYFGVKGWFLVANSQSAIITVITAFTLLFYYYFHNKNPLISLTSVVIGFSSLYFFGTQLALYSIYLLCFGFFITLLLSKKLTIKVLLVLTLTISITLIFNSKSPSVLNNKLSDTSFGEWQEIIDKVEDDIGNKPNTESSNQNETDLDGKNSEAMGEEFKKNKEKYVVVYNLYLEPIVQEFGIEKVAKEYNYSLDAHILINNRLSKTTASKLSFQEGKLMNQLFGMEQSRYIVSDVNYDVENDFHGIFYSYGYVGLAISLLFILIIFVKSIHIFFFRGDNQFDINVGLFLMVFIFFLGAAHFSGNVIKRPNVIFYFAIVSSFLYDAKIYSGRKLK